MYSSLPCGPLGIPVAYLINYSGSFCVFCQVTRSALVGSIFFFLPLTSPKRCTSNSNMAAPVDLDLAASVALLVTNLSQILPPLQIKFPLSKRQRPPGKIKGILRMLSFVSLCWAFSVRALLRCRVFGFKVVAHMLNLFVCTCVCAL